MENLDKIITIVKNWPNDMWVNCMPNKTLKVEGFLIDDNYDLIEKT